MIWKSAGGMQIEMYKEVFASIVRRIASCGRGETGGILIGCYSDDLSTAEVLLASGPGPLSVSKSSFFTRKAFGIQAELDKEFESGKYYLGEWHCHPGADSTPSSQDVRQMKSISKSVSYSCPEPILMVFGKSDPYVFNTVAVIIDDEIIKFERDLKHGCNNAD